MKPVLLFLSLIFSFNIFAWNDEYKFDHFKRIDDFDFREVVLENKQWSIVIFNNGYCPLNDSMMDCFPFEMKLNYLAPKIFARNNNIQIINMDTESSFTHQRYNLRSIPAVLFIFDGQIMNAIQLSRMNSINQLLQRTLEEIYKIPPSLN